MSKNKPVIFQIIGHGSSGKTTAVSKVIRRLHENGRKVATIKNHAHPTPLKAMDEGKDTYEHRKAGAVGSLVVSPLELQWHVKHDLELKLDDLIEFYDRLHLDVILIEGFKREKYPKLLLIRHEEDHRLIHDCSAVEAVIYWDEKDYDKLKEMTNGNVPLFHLSEEEKYIQWFVDRCTQ